MLRDVMEPDVNLSVVSEGSVTGARARELANQRKTLSLKTNAALKRLKEAAAAKERLEERSRYTVYEYKLHASEKSRMLEDDQLSQHSASSLRSSSSFASSSAWSQITIDPEMEARFRQQKLQVEEAFEKVLAANDELDLVQRRLLEAEATARERAYLEERADYKRKMKEKKLQAKLERELYTAQVKEDADERTVKEAKAARQRRKTAAKRLRLQAQQAVEEKEHEMRERKVAKATQARIMEAHLRKRAEADRMARELQEEMTQVREQEKAEQMEFERRQMEREAEIMADSRRTKQAANEEKEMREAAEKVKNDALVKARFKMSEAERIKREAEKKAQEKAESRKLREAHKKKMEEAHKKKKAEMREQARALKAALKEAAAMQYEQDAKGKLRLKADPAKELEKKMKLLQLEQEKAMRERDDEIAAKEAAFQRNKKEEARQRQLQVEAAAREVAAIFKANKEKQEAIRLADEAAKKERFRRIAKEMREKIEAENQRKREIELRQAQNLKEMKAAQFEANLAADRRRERMNVLQAQQARHLQETVWEDSMEWQHRMKEQEKEAADEARRHFNGLRDQKEAELSEKREMRLLLEEKLRLSIEEERAQRAVEEAAAVSAQLLENTEKARLKAKEVHGLKTRRARDSPYKGGNARQQSPSQAMPQMPPQTQHNPSAAADPVPRSPKVQSPGRLQDSHSARSNRLSVRV